MSSVVCPIQEAALRTPEAPAIVAAHRTYSYRDYDEHVAGAAVNLRKQGIGRGNLLAIALPTGTPTPIIFGALFRMGGIACPVNTRFPAYHLIDVLKQIRCKAMVVPYGASITTLHGRMTALAPRELVDSPVAGSADEIQIPLDRPATVVLTSGSTGSPKAALLSYGNHHHSARLSNENLALEAGDRWLLSLPLYHVAGIAVLFRCALAGAAVVIPTPRQHMGESIRRYGITHASLVPTQLHRMLADQEERAALATLKAVLVGGAPVPDRLVREAREAGIPACPTYGLTEMASQVATTRPGFPLEHLLSAGHPLDPEALAVSESGEIHVGGKALFLGYVEGADLRRPLTDDCRFATGDLGHVDADGLLHVTGRRDSMFVCGGENVHPEEVESVLAMLEYVEQAAVVPVPDDEYGAVPVAFVQLAKGAAPDTERLIKSLSERLPSYKIPRQFFPWPDDVPVGLKPHRPDLVERAKQLAGV